MRVDAGMRVYSRKNTIYITHDFLVDVEIIDHETSDRLHKGIKGKKERKGKKEKRKK